MAAILTQDTSLLRTTADINICNGLTLDFLGHLFPRDRVTGEYKVSTSSIPGAAAAYLALPSEHKVSPAPTEDSTIVTLRLPQVDNIRSLSGKFAYYPSECESRINQLLKDYFELDFYKYYLKGIQYGYQKQEIVEMYLVSRGMDPDENWEALHKRAYRKEIKTIRERMQTLQRKARYFFNEDKNNPPKK